MSHAPKREPNENQGRTMSCMHEPEGGVPQILVFSLPPHGIIFYKITKGVQITRMRKSKK